MQKKIAILIGSLMLGMSAMAQCSVCTKTAQQLGDGPAHGLNTGIIYLAFVPLLVIGVIGFRWWKNEKKSDR